MNPAQLLQIFYDECDEHLSTLEARALELEKNPSDKELLNGLFRAVHSIKGGAASLHLDEIASFSHALEELLDQMRKGTFDITQEGISLILDAGDCLKQQMAAIKRAEAVDGALAAGNIQKIHRYTANALIRSINGRNATDRQLEAKQNPLTVSQGQSGPANRFKVVYRPNPLCQQRGEDPLAVLKAFSERVTIERLEARCDDIPPLPLFSADISYLWWEMTVCSGLDQNRLRRLLAAVVGGSLEINQISVETNEGAVNSLTAHPATLLGTILVEEGMVTEHSLAQALYNQKPDAKLGEVLVESGDLTADQLESALEKQKVITRERESSSVRVNTRKLDKLVDLTGELVILRSLLGQASDMDQLMPGLGDAMTRLERHTRELQDSAISIRMLPVGNVFSRYPRLVRDLAAECGKKATIIMTGENTELDKGVIEKIGDPLTHLIRNAIDHGIETPEIRERQGKLPVGTIRLKASEEAGGVLIIVEDDGRGFDRQAIILQAQSMGLIDKAATLSSVPDSQVYSLVCQPGFSTAATVSSISGRGVGLDVVKREIESLGGTVGIESRPGLFTRFSLWLPLTLAIIEGQLVRLGDEKYVIPVASIIESRQPAVSDIKTLRGVEEVVFWQGEYIPLLRLYVLLGGNAWETEPSNALMVVIGCGGHHYALMVDELLELRPMVVKGLGGIIPKAPGIAGATILGDGKIAVVLDIPSLINLKHGAADRAGVDMHG